MRHHSIAFKAITWAIMAISSGWLGCSPATAQVMAAGSGHTCARTPTQQLYCWGWDEQGQLGDSTQNYSFAMPVHAEGITGVVSVDGGGQHTCAVVAGGAVKCWGYNRWGQLGNDTTNSANVGVVVSGLVNATQIATGSEHSCARLDNGQVWCWGHGYHGQLGHGLFTETDVPVQVSGVSGATAVAAGGRHACAIVGTGQVKCWGRNHVGQLGNGDPTADPGLASAVDVVGISTAVAIAAGDSFTCVLLQDRSVACFGHGGYGNLGNGAGANSSMAVSVTGIGDAVELAVGDYHACVRREGGGVSCWGYNYFGQAGNGTNRNNHLEPVAMAVTNASAIAAGSEHTCVRVRESPINVMCAGHGNFGQLGDNQIGGVHETPDLVFVVGGPFDVIFGAEAGAFE